MTIADVSAAGKRPRFGVFARLGEVFSLVFRRRPAAFVGIGLLLFLGAPIGFLAGIAFVMDTVDPEGELTGSYTEVVAMALTFLVLLLSWLVGASVLTLIGCDEMAGRRRGLGETLRRAVGRLYLVLLVGLFAAVLVLLGSAVFGVLGLWVSACFSVFLPALLWEEAGWGALGRSQHLTKNYRWPIMGLILVLSLGAAAVFFGFVFVSDYVPERDSLLFNLVIAMPVLAQIALLPLFCAVPPVVHARLRAIKDGDGKELRAVFE